MVRVCCHFTQTSFIMVGFSHTSLGVLLVVFNLFQFANNLRKTPLKLQSPIFWMQSHLDHRLAFLSYLFTAHLRSTQQSWRSHVPGLKISSLTQWGPISCSWLSCSMNTDCANHVLQKFCSIKVCLQCQCRLCMPQWTFFLLDWSWGWIYLDIVMLSDACLILLEWYFCDTTVLCKLWIILLLKQTL